jgi:5-formyltetrahydrofolate cyclo-ligase
MTDQNMDQIHPNSRIEKATLRRSLLHTRRSLSPEAWRTQSDRLCDHLQADPHFAHAQTILAYLSFRQEPDLSSLFHRFTHKQWGIPRCVGKSLIWHRWSPNSPLQPGAYGILEPASDAPMLEPEAVDLILVPAVGGDRQGYRLGYGGGFYDRLLSDPAWANIPTLGILFHFALLPQLPTDPWDQPLQGFCTETALRWF